MIVANLEHSDGCLRSVHAGTTPSARPTADDANPVGRPSLYELAGIARERDR